MITLHITIATAIFSVMFAYRNYWQINELGYKRYPTTKNMVNGMFQARKKWHSWQFALQIYIGAVISFISFVSDYSLLNSFGHGLLFGSVFWLVFDTLLGYKLTKNILHVDSNGIGTIYRKAFKSFAPYALLISKVLFVTLSIIISFYDCYTR